MISRTSIATGQDDVPAMSEYSPNLASAIAMKIRIGIRRHASAVMAVAFLATAAVSPAEAAKRVALVIGNSNYKLIPSLDNPRNDAALMSSTLNDLGFDVVEAKNADQNAIKRAIRDFVKRLRRAGPKAVGLFYDAGHGVQANGTNHLIPLGAQVDDEADLEVEAVSASWVLAQMKSARNSLNMVIMDACRNNPFKGTFRSGTGGARAHERAFRGPDRLRRRPGPIGRRWRVGEQPIHGRADDGDARSEPAIGGHVPARPRHGRTGDGQQADAVGGKFAQGQVLLRHPWPRGRAVPGPVAPAPTPTQNRPPSPPRFDVRAMELAFWNSIKGSTDAADFEEYLKKFPDGLYAGLARNRLTKPTPQDTAALSSPRATPAFTVTEMEKTLRAAKHSNVRAGPGTTFDKIGRQSTGDEVKVTGKAEDRNWYRIAMADGKTGFVFASLLSETRRSGSGPVSDSGSDVDVAVLGMMLSAVTPELRRRFQLGNTVDGVVVTGMEKGSTAAEKKIRPGDIIFSVGHDPIERIKRTSQVEKYIDAMRKASRKAVLVRVVREDRRRFFAIKIDKK